MPCFYTLKLSQPFLRVRVAFALPAAVGDRPPRGWAGRASRLRPLPLLRPCPPSLVARDLFSLSFWKPGGLVAPPVDPTDGHFPECLVVPPKALPRAADVQDSQGAW